MGCRRIVVATIEGCGTCSSTGGGHRSTGTCDSAHPHANDFKCGTCGDKYDTGTMRRMRPAGQRCCSCGKEITV